MSKQSMLVPVIGQFAVAPILRVQPTVQRSTGTAAVGAKLRRRYTITNTGTEPVASYDYLISIGETATAFVAAGKALASGDDVRFALNGLEVARTLRGWNGASSGAWVRIPYLAAGGTITFDMLYSNPQAGTPPTLTDGDDAPIFNTAASTNASWIYTPQRSAAYAGKGAWYLSTGLAQPEIKLGLPGSWQPVTTLGSDDDKRQQIYTSYDDTGTTYYQSRFAAKRQRSGTMTANEKNGADGVMIRVPVGITSVNLAIRMTNMAIGDTDTTPVGQVVILTRNSDNAPWSILYSNTTLADTEVLVLAATYTPAAPVKQLAFAVWPYSGGRINRKARQDRYVEGNWADANVTLGIDSSKLVQSTAQGETTVYELATELRYGGGGAAVGVAPYHSLYLGNAKSATGAGTPRLTAELNNQIQLDTKTRRPELWNSGLTAKVEDIPLDTVQAVDGVLDGVTGALVERDAAEWMPWVPVVNPLPNASFANGLTGWAVGSTHASATVTRSADAAVFSDTASSLKVAITASTVPTTTLVTDDLNTTYVPIGTKESVVVSHDVRVSTLNLVPRAKIAFYTEALALISEATEAQADGALAAINTWERHTFAARVPAGAVYWRFALDVYSAALNATGNVWLDNVRAYDVDIVVKGVSPGTLVVSASWYGRFAYA